MKKLLCILLSVVMLLSMTACGNHGTETNGGNGSQPSSGGNTENDTVWVLVQESDMGSSRYIQYIYDANGERIGAEFYMNNKKTSETKFITTRTDSGGKLVTEISQPADGDAPATRYTYEYDANGRLIHVISYDPWGDPSGREYTFRYNDNGQLIEQRHIKDGQVQEKLTFVYDGEKLKEGHFWNYRESYGHYIYSYDANGVPVKAEVKTDYGDLQEYTLDFVTEQGRDQWQLSTTEECDNIVGGRRLFYYSVEKDRDGKPCRMQVSIKTWGVFCTGWIPLVSFGCIDTNNYFIGAAELYYEPLDVHLAKQQTGE